MLPFQRTFCIFVPCGNAGHTPLLLTGGFATSGGATRPSGSAEQQLLALVRAFAIPPPAPSC